MGGISPILCTRDAGRQGEEQGGGNKYHFHLSKLVQDYAASNRDTCIDYRSGLGFHSRASFCASAIWAGVILAAMELLVLVMASEVSS